MGGEVGESAVPVFLAGDVEVASDDVGHVVGPVDGGDVVCAHEVAVTGEQLGSFAANSAGSTGNENGFSGHNSMVTQVTG